jgi:formylglycine-generating enzyme required for sulfatase activity
MLLALLACSTEGHPPPALEVAGMVPVAAGVVELGPRKLPPVDGAPSFLDARDADKVPGNEGGPRGGPPGQPHPAPPGQPGPIPGGRPDRQPGAPPPGQHDPQHQGAWQPWQILDGMQLEPRSVQVEAFWIDRTEVTRAAYKVFLDATGYRPPYVDESWSEDDWNWSGTDFAPGTGDHPVVLVSFYDAEAYCGWADKRLPSEAEWQLAALGPASDQATWPWGEAYSGDRFNHGTVDVSGFDDSDGYRTTAPVGSFPSGRAASGAEDMFGNAWEWTSDPRVESWDLVGGPAMYMAVRGASYFTDLRPNPAGERHHFLAEVRRKTSGFRCARTARPE